MLINPTIVIAAFNRPASLQRLLNSLLSAVYTNPVQLIISIDKSNSIEVRNIAENFEWNFGFKKVVCHDKHLGLKKHILYCGSLTKEFEAIVILEDDLLVSPYFYEYAKQAYSFYKDDNAVAGISLYNYQVAESCFYPFKAIDDGSDVYFMQVASSWGQLFTNSQWTIFETWFSKNLQLTDVAILPNYIKEWGTHSWKKHFIHYLIAENKYFVFPRLSLTTNFEEEGTNSATTNIFHVPLQLANKHYVFQKMQMSLSVYDAWFEILPSCLNKFNRSLVNYNYEIDLYGSKDITNNNLEYILTSKQSQEPLLSFGADLFPLETNIVLNVNGNEIGLYNKSKHPFLSKKLNLYNVLDAINLEKEFGISIVIPLMHFDENELKTTIQSISSQTIKYCECIIVSSVENQTVLSDFMSLHNFKAHVIYNSQTKDLSALLATGLKRVSNGIVTWIFAGNSFENDAFSKVSSIFKSYASINWLCGVNKENCDNKTYYDLTNYRLNQGEVYEQVLNNNLNTSTQGHFFRKNCIPGVADNSINTQQLFFRLMSHYQLIVVAYPFYNNKLPLIKVMFSFEEKKQLLSKYAHFKSGPISFRSKLISWFLKIPPLADDSYRWYESSIKKMPDVLRFDSINNTFYFSKY